MLYLLSVATFNADMQFLLHFSRNTKVVAPNLPARHSSLTEWHHGTNSPRLKTDEADTPQPGRRPHSENSTRQLKKFTQLKIGDSLKGHDSGEHPRQNIENGGLRSCQTIRACRLICGSSLRDSRITRRRRNDIARHVAGPGGSGQQNSQNCYPECSLNSLHLIFSRVEGIVGSNGQDSPRRGQRIHAT